MSEKSFTFLEIHLGDGSLQLGPKSIGGTDPESEPASAALDDDSTSTASTSCPCPLCEDGCDCRVCALGKVALVLGVLAAIALVAWKVVGDTDLEAAEDLDELAD